MLMNLKTERVEMYPHVYNPMKKETSEEILVLCGIMNVFKSNIQQQQIHNKSQLCKPVSAFGYILILPLQYIFIVFIQGSPTKQNSIMIVDPVWNWSL